MILSNHEFERKETLISAHGQSNVLGEVNSRKDSWRRQEDEAENTGLGDVFVLFALSGSIYWLLLFYFNAALTKPTRYLYTNDGINTGSLEISISTNTTTILLYRSVHHHVAVRGQLDLPSNAAILQKFTNNDGFV